MIEFFFAGLTPLWGALVALTLLTVFVSVWRNPQCAVALFVSLVWAKLVTYSGDPAEFVHVLFVCGFICVFSPGRGNGWFLDVRENGANYVVAFLYALSIVPVLGMMVGLYAAPIMWELRALILVPQLLITVGSVHSGMANRIDRMVASMAQSGVERIGIHSFDAVAKKKGILLGLRKGANSVTAQEN